MSDFEEMLLLPKHLYDMILKHEDQAIREAATTINIKQLNNLDVHDNATATINNDDNFLGVDRNNPISSAKNSQLHYQDDGVYPTVPMERILPPSLITTTPNFQTYGGGGQSNNVTYNTNLADRNASNGQENPLLKLQSVLKQRLMSQPLSTHQSRTPQEERLQRGEMFNALPDHLRNENPQTAFFPPAPVSQQMSAPPPPVYNTSVFPPSAYQIPQPQFSQQNIPFTQPQPPPPPQAPEPNQSFIQPPPEAPEPIPAIAEQPLEIPAIAEQPLQVPLQNPNDVGMEQVIANINDARAMRRERARVRMRRRRERERESNLARIGLANPISTELQSTAATAPVAVGENNNGVVDYPPSPSTQLARRQEVIFNFPTMPNAYNAQQAFAASNPRLTNQLEGRRFAIGMNEEDMSSALARITAVANPENTVSSIDDDDSNRTILPSSSYNPQHTFIPSNPRPTTQSEGRRFAIGMDQDDMSTALARITAVAPQENTVSSINDSVQNDQQMLNLQNQTQPNQSQHMNTQDDPSQLAIDHQSRDEANMTNAIVPASQQFPVADWSNLQRTLHQYPPVQGFSIPSFSSYRSENLPIISLPASPNTSQFILQDPHGQQAEIMQTPLLALPAPRESPNTSQVRQQSQILHSPRLALPPPRESPNTSQVRQQSQILHHLDLLYQLLENLPTHHNYLLYFHLFQFPQLLEHLQTPHNFFMEKHHYLQLYQYRLLRKHSNNL